MSYESHLSDGSAALFAFLLSYVILVLLFAATLGLGWALDEVNSGNEWPSPLSHGSALNLALLALLASLGGLPPFFFLGPKLALFSWLMSLGAWGSALPLGVTLLIGWYVYWQGASSLLNPGAYSLGKGRGVSSGGAAVMAAAILAPLALVGFLTDLWLLACWIS